jgi:hypothetical protein
MQKIEIKNENIQLQIYSHFSLKKKVSPISSNTLMHKVKLFFYFFISMGSKIDANGGILGLLKIY